MRPAGLLLALLVVQVTLGALTVLTGKQYVINSLHVVTGASVLVTSLVLTLRAHRARFPTRGVPEPDRPARSGSDRPESSDGGIAPPATRPAGARA